MTGREFTVRNATDQDADAVIEFASRIWTDRGGDYLPHIYEDWIAGDGDDQRTFVVDAGDGAIAGIVQAVLLSEHEAWFQGMRVNPAFRDEGVAAMLNDASFDWAAERGATAGRIMVFSWNAEGLGAARASGFDPAMAFRWAHPDPADAPASVDGPGSVDSPGSIDSDRVVTSEPDAAWSYWMRSDARNTLGDLALAPDESWACAELTREALHDATSVFAVQGEGGTTAMAFRVRDFERSNDEDESEHWAEYGASAWADVESARTLFAAIAEDAATLGADRTRVLIPETPRHVSDTAWARTSIGDEPDFVLERDLTDRR